MNTTTSHWANIGPLSEIPDGSGTSFVVGDRKVAVFRCDGHVYAIDDRCPHLGAPLAKGSVEEATVTCPWHGWEINLTTGSVSHDPAKFVACWGIRMKDGEVIVMAPA